MIRGMSVLLITVLWISIPSTDLAPTFNNPGTVTLNENDDSGRSLWTVSATCYPSNNVYNYDGYGDRVSPYTTSYTVGCETCTASSGFVSGLFYWSGNTVHKYSCSATSCGACPSCTACSTSNGCLTGPATYNIVVRCYTTYFDNNDDGTSTLTVSVAEETPILTISLPGSVNADNSMSVNDVLATATKSSGPAIVEYTKSSAVSNTYLLNTANMFELNTANGQVYVATDPSVEYDYTYSMGICIYSRRQESCGTLPINFDGCFQTPNCKDQTNYGFSDQHAVGATLFTMIYDNPSDHFTAISSTWQNLNFVKVYSTLAEASIDSKTGVISTTGNVTVWPEYPYSTHTFVVRVSNPGYSCSYTATCTMIIRFSFTNWPIRFVSLPNTTNIHEDTDNRTLVHSIITYDPNDPDHDNVTCVVTANDDPTLLELIHDGNYDYDSWFIYKKKCNEPGCGYIDENFLCDEGIGCLNYDLDDEYTITIQCSDAYGSSDTETFTLQVTENQPPSFTNTPTNITINTRNVAQFDRVFSIYYSDSEGETLDYNFTIKPSTPSVFVFDTRGNYYDNPCNVTTTVSQWDQGNMTFAVSFCGRERRNIVCSDFNINIREYCGPTPVCSDDSTTVTDQFAIGGELFQINVTGSGYTSLSYGITSEYSNLFSVDPLAGIVTSAATLEANSPPSSTIYSIVVHVNDTAACAVAACTLNVEVIFTNFPIRFISLPNTTYIHEDTDSRTLVHSIITYDPNNPDHDNVTCTETANEDTALLELTHNGNYSYDSWFIYKKACLDPGCGYLQDNFLCGKDTGCMNYDLRNQNNITIRCSDAYGSSDTATFTLDVIENQPPVFNNTPSTVTINKEDIVNSDTVFVIYYSDKEKEELDFNFTVNPPTPSLFAFDTHSNYDTNPAKITFDISTSQRKSLNGTYIVTFCGTDRRNIVCSNITINITVPDKSKDSENVGESFPIGWLLLGITLAIVIVVAFVLIACWFRKKVKSLKDALNERNNINDTQDAQTNVRSDRSDENELESINQYEELQHDRDQGHIYDGHRQVALSQDDVDINIGVDEERQENDLGQNVDDYLHPISSGIITGGSNDFQNTIL